MKQIYISLLLIFSFFLQPVLGQPDFPGDWSVKVRIELDSDKINSTLTDFPVAVFLDNTNFDFSSARPDGRDVRFTAADGTTKLTFERELHDNTGEQAVYWVKIPSVSSSENTVFYLFYGNSDASDAASTDGTVWSKDTRRGGVWHMEHMADNGSWLIEDSRHNNEGNKVSETSPGQVAGLIGKAQEFDGIDDRITVFHSTGPGGIQFTSEVTLSAWVKPEIGAPLLDNVEGAVAAYSLRKLQNNYSGSAISVRRSSDNLEIDIGFDIHGNLDVAALLDHVGSGSSDNGFVVTWYDQSGSDYNVTQAIHGSQPVIVQDGEVVLSDGIPMVRFDNDFLNGSLDMGSQYPDATLNAVWRQTSDGNSEVPVFIGENNAEKGLRIGYFYFPASQPWLEPTRFNVIELWQYDFATISGFSSNLKIQTGTYDNIGAGNSEMQVFIDGVGSTAKTDAGQFDAGDGYANTPITIGANADGSDYLQDAYVAEIIVYGQVLSAQNRELLENNQMACYGLQSPVIAGKGRDAYQLEICNSLFVGYINGDTITAQATFSQYQHVVMTYDQSSLKLYVDGVEVNSKSKSGAINTNTQNLYIGERFAGIIDEVRVTNTARLADWIEADYHSGLNDLLGFDRSGFSVEHPGKQIKDAEFNLLISNARDESGDLINGSINVTISSNQTEGEVHNEVVPFTSGAAEVPVTLTTVDFHDLTVAVAGVLTPVILVGVEVLDEDMSGFNLSVTPAGDQITGDPFTLVITNAKDPYGDDLEGDANVIITSSEEGEIFNGIRSFNEGGAQRNITLYVAAEHILTVNIEGITQDETISVQVNAVASNIVFITDELSIIAGGISDLITVQLQDASGNQAVSATDITIELASDSDGAFLEGELEIGEIIIPAGTTEVSFRYTSTLAGVHELSAEDAAETLTGDTQNLMVDPAAAASILFTTVEQTITAGETSEVITVQLEDEYGNVAGSSGETTINLSSDLSGTFLNVADDDDITFVTIPDAGSEASFRYTSTVAGIHELSAVDDATENPLTGDTQDLTVNPAAPAAIVFASDPRTITAGETSDIIAVQLQDEFGNEVFSSGTTTIDLASDLGGTFRDKDDTGDITFIEIADTESEASFLYTSTVVGTHELSANDAATEGPLTGDTQNLEVEPAAPAAIVFTTAERTITAGEVSEVITIQLRDEFGNEAFSSGPTTVNLTSDQAATFRDEDDDLQVITSVEIADAASEASFKYTSTVAGVHELSADDDAASLTGGTQDLTVDPDAPDKIVFITEEQIVQINLASEVITVQLQDQYDNIAFSDGVTTIDLGSDLDGDFRDVANTVTITDLEIADQESEASFRFRPTAEGTHTLSAGDAALALTGDTQELIAIGVYVFFESGDWNNEDSWEGGTIPPEGSRVIIESGILAGIDSDDITVLYLEIYGILNYSTGSSLTVKNNGRITVESVGQLLAGSGTLVIDDNAQLLIKPGGLVTSSGTLTNNAGTDGLIIESAAGTTGSLIVNSTGVDATVQRYVTGNEWHVFGAPVSGMTIGEFLTGNDEENDIFYNSSQDVHAMTHYDETISPNGSWAPYYGPADHSTLLQSGRSYLIRKRTDGVLYFRGELVPSISGLGIPRTVSGWHSLGNPFTSALRIRGDNTNRFLYHNAVINENLDPDYAVLYIYDPANPSMYSIISNSQSIDPPRRPVINQNNVQSGQGFLVRAKENSSTVNFTTGMRGHSTGTTFFKKSTGGEEEEEKEEYWPTLILNVSNDSKEAFTTIAFNENMTTGLDVTYDAGLLGGERAFKLYTRLVEDDNGVNFAIQCLPDYSPENLVIPVGFDFSAGGQARFSTDVFVLPDGAKAYLEDRLLEVFTDLGEEDYVVDLPSGTEGTGRFFVHVDFQVTSTEEILKPAEGLLDIYSYGNEVFIRGLVEHETDAVVYDIMGRKIKTVRLQPAEMNSFMMEGHGRGVYLIHVIGNDIHQTKRVYID